MRVFRVIVVCLIAVGICGVVYLGLATGLAAYVRYKTGTRLDGGPASGPSPSDIAAQPVATPKIEDTGTPLERRLTAPRPGLTTPPPFARAPFAGIAYVIPLGSRTATPQLDLALAHKSNTRAIKTDPLPIPVFPEVAPPAIEPAGAGSISGVRLNATPPARVSSPSASQVPISSIAAFSNTGRPDVLDDSTVAAGEKLLLKEPAPLRKTPAEFEKALIPEPTASGGPGEVKTPVPDNDPPISPPDRPTPIKLPVKP